MNNLKEEYKSLIGSLSEDNFKLFVKEYLKMYWETNEVEICDGPWDGGNDANVYINKTRQKRNIQITVQKNYETKLKKDIEKSAKNCQKYNYLRDLDFFISSAISAQKKNELERSALLSNGINLKIYDANKLSEDVGSYSSLAKFINDIYAPKSLNTKIEINSKNKLLYDMFSTGSNVANIKYDFINSYIQYCLLYKDAGITEISDYVNEQLGSKLSSRTIENQLGIQVKKNIITFHDGKYALTEEYKQKFLELKNISYSLEQNLLHKIELCISKYDIQITSSVILNKILALYKAHYDSEIEELNSTKSSFEPKERKVYNELVKYIEKEGNISNAVPIVKEILQITSESEYLNKISITSLFTSLFKSNKLEKYIEQTNRNVYLDTQILLQLVCVLYVDTEYDDTLYESVKYLMYQTREHHNKVQFHTTSNYIDEVANHLWDAYQLRRLLALPMIKDLGQSKNVFFNFYLYLQKNAIRYFEDFDEFIYDLLGDEFIIPNNRTDFIKEVYTRLIDILHFQNIEIHSLPFYEDFGNLLREYEIEISDSKNKKSKRARENDLACILYLSDEINHIDNITQLFDEPYFITWDSSFYKVRNRFIKNYNYSYWYIYTPIKFANRLSVMNLKLESKRITYDIISLAETNFKLSNDRISFIDTLSSYFNKENINDWKLATKLTQMKQRQKEDITLQDFMEKNNNNSPIDEVLKAIQIHYTSADSKIRFTEVVEFFENNDNVEVISQIISDNCSRLIRENEIPSDMYNKLDKLINNVKE